MKTKDAINDLIMDISFDMLDMNADHYVYDMLNKIKTRLIEIKLRETK